MADGIIKALLPQIDTILSIRDQIGAIIEPVSFVTRTWYKDEAKTTLANAPEGYFSTAFERLLPTPKIVNFSQDVRLREGGAIKAGDIVLQSISKNKFSRSELDGTSTAPNIERLYAIGDKIYQVINVTEKYVTWNVQLRELTNQER
jgi:hypothetical protein